MKNLVLALLTAHLLGVIICLILLFGVFLADRIFPPNVYISAMNAALAIGWVGIILTTVSASFIRIADALDRRDTRRSLATGRPTMIHSFVGFAISWPMLLVFGTLTIFAIINGSNTLAGAIAGAIAAAGAGDPEKSVIVGLILIASPLQLMGGYIVGWWIGTRSARNGIAVVLMSAALASVLTPLVVYLLLTLTGKEVPAGVIEGTIERFGTFSISGLVGYWRGQHQKLSRYMQYLLSVLPNELRDDLVDLAFGEAQRAISKSSVSSA